MMASIIELSAKVLEDGTFQFYAPNVAKQLLGHLEGKDVLVHVAKLSKTRSNRQNRWLWGVAYVIIREFYLETQGEDITPNEIHLHNLQVIQGSTLVRKKILGEEVMVFEDKKSSTMTTVEFKTMMEKLQAWYASIGCEIPDPVGENLYENYL